MAAPDEQLKSKANKGENTWNQITYSDLDKKGAVHPMAKLHLGSTLPGETEYTAIEQWEQDPKNPRKQKAAADAVRTMYSKDRTGAVEEVAKLIEAGASGDWEILPSYDVNSTGAFYHLDISTKASFDKLKVDKVREYFRDHADQNGAGAKELRKAFLDTRKDRAAALVLELPLP